MENNDDCNRLPVTPSHKKVPAWGEKTDKKYFNLPNHENSGNHNETLHEKVKIFGERTTAHGVSFLIVSQTIFGRIFWLLVVIAALIATGYFALNVLRDSYDYTTKIDLISRSNLEFPAVTICNMNRLRRSQLPGTRFEGLIGVDDGQLGDKDNDYLNDSRQDSISGLMGAEYSRKKRDADYGASSDVQNANLQEVSQNNDSDNYEIGADSWQLFGWDFDWDHDFESSENVWGDVIDENDWKGFYVNSKVDDFSDIIDVANPTREELEELGHQAEDFIAQCTFDKRNCNYTDFKVFQNKHYGNCFTFNHGTRGDIPRITSKYGAQFGLHLTLFIEQPEYLGIFTPESGVRISVHDRRLKPFPEDDGLNAAPGFATSVGIKQVSISRLGQPYGECESDKLLQTDGQYSDYIYTSRECRKDCLQDELFERCQCVTDILLNSYYGFECSLINGTQQQCRQLVEDLYEDDKLECYCPTACNESTYDISSSSSRWPSKQYEKHFKQRLYDMYKNNWDRNRVKDAVRFMQNVDTTRENFVRLRIYFEELNYQRISQEPLHTMESILGNIGGLMGIYFGGSLITLIEILVFILGVIKLGFKKIYDINRVHPIDTTT